MKENMKNLINKPSERVANTWIPLKKVLKNQQSLSKC